MLESPVNMPAHGKYIEHETPVSNKSPLEANSHQQNQFSYCSSQDRVYSVRFRNQGLVDIEEGQLQFKKGCVLYILEWLKFMACALTVGLINLTACISGVFWMHGTASVERIAQREIG